MKKKGFTLLELLAVIIILAVIALIATPIVLNVVDEAKKSSFQDSAYGIIKAGEYYYTSKLLDGGMSGDKTFNFPNNTELEFSGTIPKGGYIKVTKDGLVEIAIHDGKYCATKGLKEETVTIKNYVDGECGVGQENNLTVVNAVEVTELPTENINENILYLYDGSYYKYENYFSDILFKIFVISEPISIVESYEKDGLHIELYDVQTKPVDDVAVSGERGLFIYFVRDENDLFIYGDIEETGENAWASYSEMMGGSFGGIVSDASEITEDGIYAVVKTWTKFAPVSGAATIIENGTYDVTNNETLSVEVQDATICGVWKFNDVIDLSGIKMNTREMVSFYTAWTENGVEVEMNGVAFDFHLINDEAGLQYNNYVSGSGSAGNSAYVEGTWKREEMKTVDFGDAQSVHSWFKEWLTTNATPIYTITQTEDANATNVVSVLSDKRGDSSAINTMSLKENNDDFSRCDVIIDNLSDENIEENVVYYCGGNYYAYRNRLNDVLVGTQSINDFLPEIQLTYHYLDTKPTENIIETSDANGIQIYYIADENNLFIYGDFAESGENVWGSFSEMMGISFSGIVSDAREATEDGMYAVVKKWTKFVPVSGTITITENGTYDVTNKETLIVEVPDEPVVGFWQFDKEFSGGDTKRLWTVNFSAVVDGEQKNFNGIDFDFDGGAHYLYYLTENGERINVFHSVNYFENNGWKDDTVRNINFGTNPRIVTSVFKEWLVANATPIYTIVKTEK